LNKEEKEARKVCAFCNWVKECKDCPHREWPSVKWHKNPRWNYLECNDWKYYLRKPHEKFIRKLRKLLRLHKWFEEVEYGPARLVRTCTICGKKQGWKYHKLNKGRKWVDVK